MGGGSDSNRILMCCPSTPGIREIQCGILDAVCVNSNVQCGLPVPLRVDWVHDSYLSLS